MIIGIKKVKLREISVVSPINTVKGTQISDLICVLFNWSDKVKYILENSVKNI